MSSILNRDTNNKRIYNIEMSKSKSRNYKAWSDGKGGRAFIVTDKNGKEKKIPMINYKNNIYIT